MEAVIFSILRELKMAIANINNEKFFLRLIRQGKLKVTKDGRTYNLITGRELSKVRQCDCYRKLSWQHPKTKKIIQIQLHRIVWAYFNGIPEPNLVLNHIDGNKQNCALSNLELVSVMENNLHAHKNNLIYIPRGEERDNAKFSDEDVIYLRKYYSTNKDASVRKIAQQYKCSTAIVSAMLRSKYYNHIKTKYDNRCIQKLNKRRFIK